MKFISYILVVLISFSASSVFASEKSHLEAADKLLVLIEADKLMKNFMEQMIKIQVQEEAKREPCLRPYENVHREVVTEFAKKLINVEEFKKRAAKLYTEHFTEDELNQIIAFYSTPVGKKVLEKMPLLAQKGAELGQQLVQEGLKQTETQEFKDSFKRFRDEKYKSIDPKTVTPECKKWFEENIEGKKAPTAPAPAAKKDKVSKNSKTDSKAKH